MWKFQVGIILRAQDNFEMLTQEPTEEEKTKQWLVKDANAQRIITATVDKKILIHLMSCKTAHQMWEKLCSMFERDHEQLKCNLLQEFFSFEYDKNADVATNISKLVNMTYRLKSLEMVIDDDMLMAKILGTLPQGFKHFRSAWESTAKTERTLENLTARLTAEEERLTGKEERTTAVAYQTKERRCYRCNSTSHIAWQCKSKTNNESNKVKCYKCNKEGHYAASCKQKTESKYCIICKKTNHTEKQCYFRDKSVQETDKINKGNKVAYLTRELGRSDDWVVDSGTTTHMTNTTKNMSNIRKINSTVGVAKENETMKVEAVGCLEFEQCILKNVMVVPELSTNLLSVTEINKNGGKVTFEKGRVTVENGERQILTGDRTEEGLYKVSLKREKENKANVIVIENNVIEQWHRRLGHLSKGGMLKLLQLSTGINITENQLKKYDLTCEICMKARQTRLSFSETRTRATRPIQLIHTDVCGPLEADTWDGKRYFATFLDDYTHYVETHLLKNKSDVQEFLIDFINKIEARWCSKVSKIRCDNGREYVNNKIINWTKMKGIEMDCTVPHTPQLNGKAERLNRTLMEKTRALLFDSKMEKEMWGEALYTATYLLNRSPMTTEEKTPIENWESRKPNLSRIQMFGSEVRMKITGQLRKLDARSDKHLMIGYAPNGYRLWDKIKRKIIISRDVIVQERKTEDCHIEEGIVLNIPYDNNEEECSSEQVQNVIHEEREEEQQQEDISMEWQSCNSEEEDNEDSQETPVTDQETLRRSNRIRHLPERYNSALLTFQQAVTGPDKDRWMEAINDEKEAMRKNDTWTMVNASEVQGKRPLSSRWVLKIKDDGRYRARLVVRGCQQKKDLDYEEIYSPVVSNASLRALFSIAVIRNLRIITLDIKTAFLHGNLKETIYMYPPQGYNESGKVFKLKKAVYGLKQAPFCWNERFSEFLKEKNLIPLKSDRCLFKRENSDLMLGLYVDDGLVIGSDEEEMRQLLKELENTFEMTIDKKPQTFLGMDLHRIKDGIRLFQGKYADKVLEKYRMENSKPAGTPINPCSNAEEERTSSSNFPYREAVGSLLYLSTKTRPDLAYAVGFCSRYVESPTDRNITDVKRILRYLKGTVNNGIQYKRQSDDDTILAYCDSDFAGDHSTRRSTTGYVICYGDGPILWTSRRQPMIATSSTEAEFIAAAECCKDLRYVKMLIEEIIGKKVKVKLQIDNQGAISLISSGAVNKRSKHIDIKYRYVSETVKTDLVQVEYCPTNNQVADVLTKPLASEKFRKFKGELMDSN